MQCALNIPRISHWLELSLPRKDQKAYDSTLCNYTGTHVDAPYHFFADGKKIDEIPLSAFIGQGLVINLATKGGRKIITWDDLAPYSSKMHEGVIVLLLTGWSAHWNTPRYNDHPFISREAAEGIMSCGVCVVGIDTLSVDETIVDGTANDASFAAHEVILGSGGIIAENLTNLEAIVGQDAVVSLVPLNIQGCDGSPVRAYARSAVGGFQHNLIS